MHLFRTKYEAIIEAPIEEVRALGAHLTNMKIGETQVFVSAVQAHPVQDAEFGQKVVVVADEGLFFASWKSGTGLIVRGEPESLQAFAEAFDFQCEPISGIHAHWDYAACSNLIHEDSLPIVVQVQ